MFFVAFQPNAFQSNAFQEGYGVSAPVLRRDGGEEGYPKRRKRLETFKPERFIDAERKNRLRNAIESQFYEPEVQQVVFPYVEPSRTPFVGPTLDWEKIWQNFEQIEQNLALLQKTAAHQRMLALDDDDLLRLI